jgi:hypothetical protein
MSDFLPDPPRWKDQIQPSNLIERAAGIAVRSLDPPKPLSTSQLARIAIQVRPDQTKRFPTRFWLTVTVALLLGGATAASAAHLNILPNWLTPTIHPESVTKTAANRSISQPKGRRAKKEVPSALPVENSTELNDLGSLVPIDKTLPQSPAAAPIHIEPTPIGKGVERTPSPTATRDPSGSKTPDNPVRREPPTPSVIARQQPSLSYSTEPAPLVPSPVPSLPHNKAMPDKQVAWVESPTEPKPALPAPPTQATNPSTPATRSEGAAKLLAEAIRTLRVDHSPKAALTLLDRHETELDRGALGHEVLIVRVEALLLLHRRAEALSLLDVAALTDVAAQRSLLVTRGELRAAVGRCTEALGDFELVLAKSNPPDQRALQGRAGCTTKLGDRR